MNEGITYFVANRNILNIYSTRVHSQLNWKTRIQTRYVAIEAIVPIIPT